MRIPVSSTVRVTVQDASPVLPQREKLIDALTDADEKLYRSIFDALKKGDEAKIDQLTAKLSDKGLLGHVLAQRHKLGAPRYAALKSWLEAYGDLPEADEIYDQAASLAKKEKIPASERPSKPAPSSNWAGASADSAPAFPIDLKASLDPADTKQARLAQALTKALTNKDPYKARNLLIDAQNQTPLAGTFVADAEAAIAARFFYAGERAQAQTLATAAAGANQPLGLWIKGLIAWEQDDLPTAAASFARLAEHPSLNPPTKAAASFWAARAHGRMGNVKQARNFYDQAAQQPRSFYGLLAAQALGRNPASGVAKDSVPAWTREQRAVLIAHKAGWRALALIQIGETGLAESELRRLNPRSLNPQGQGELQQAMLALAGFVPMPALVVQLASLTSRAETAMFDSADYPLPPWQPQQGFKIDRALVYALMRHESRFDPKAVSGRGALGLMQIMPSTAHVMQASFSDDSQSLSHDSMMEPSVNLALGQTYIAHLAEQPKIGDNLILLLAAYNGGPTKLTGWAEGQKARLSGASARDPLLFLESIPSRETRTYVMRVLPHYWAYRARLGESLTSLRQLAEGQWPRFTLEDKGQSKTAEARPSVL